MKKCCITCAFCLRKVKYKKGYMLDCIDNGEVVPLSEEEILDALDNNFNFLNKEKEKYEKWHQLYKEKKEEKRQKELEFKKSLNNKHLAFKNSITKSFFSNIVVSKVYINGDKSIYDDYKEFGITDPPPDEVKYSSLCCFEKRWSEIRNPQSDEINDKILTENDCPFYYSYKDREGKSLVTCQKEREAIEQKNRDKLKEEEVNIAKQALEKSQEALLQNQETKDKISEIINSLLEAKNITKEIANYTKENQKSSNKQFLSSIIISLIAIIIAVSSLISSSISSSKIETLLKKDVEQNTQIVDLLNKH